MADISSLGIGSGVLTADVIDKLRDADENRIIKPLDSKIELQAQKQEAFTLIESLVDTFRSSVSTLSFSTIYQSRSVDVTDGNVEVSAEAGANVEDFSLSTTTLAKKDINQSGAFTSTSDTIADGDGTFNISLGDGSSFDIDYTSTTTLSELAQLINDEASSKVKASVVQTGDNAFSLVVSSRNTGTDQAISFNDTPDVVGSGLKDALYNDQTATSGFTNNQSAIDATFVYNGITISRSSNEVSDLLSGVTINLKTEGEDANVSIAQDTTAISTEFQLLVDSYNALQVNLTDVSTSNEEAGTRGVFSGESFIKSIQRDIDSVLTSFDSENRSLVNFGIELDRNGELSFDKSVFETEISNDPAAVELFLAGGIDPDTSESKTGFFQSFNDKLKEYTGFSGLFDTFEAGLKERSSSLSKERASSIESLDSRYGILTKQFIAYDGLISKLNAQFSSLQLQIQAAANGG